MRLSGRLGAWCATVAMIAATLGCTQGPISGPTPLASASPGPSASSTLSPSRAARPTTPTVVKAMLPTETLPVRVLAVSGENILVQGDGGFTYRLSHDAGRTWAATDFPCADADGCTVVPPTSDQVGRAVDGIVTAYSWTAQQLESYSLVTGSRVGTSVTITEADSVYDLAGGLALLYNSLTDSYRVRSLLDGSERALPKWMGSAFRLFDDGSVLVTDTDTGTTSQRIAPDGSTTTIPFAMGGDAVVNGTVIWFGRSSRAHKLPEFCAYDLATKGLSCRRGVTRWDHGYAVGSTGMVLSGYTGGAVRLYWLAYSGGSVAPPRQLGTLRAWDSGRLYSAENAAPLVAVRSEVAGSLARPVVGGVTQIGLPWAIRPTLPSSLGLGASSIVGSFHTHSRGFSWFRSLSTTSIGAVRRLGGTGDVAASGSLWALSSPSGDLQVWSRGRVTRILGGFEETSALVFAGSALFGRPLCRKAPLETDDDCEGPAVLAEATTGKRISVPVGAEDAWGSLLVYRGGDHTVSSTTFVVIDFRNATTTPITIDLPDPGTGGYYTDVRLHDDWIGTTQHLANGSFHPVLANYRTHTVLVGAQPAQLLALGDGIAVSALAHTTTLQVWEPTTGATQALAASSTVVAVDGTRLAYTTGNQLAVADFAR